MKVKTFYIPLSNSTIQYVTGYVNNYGDLVYKTNFSERKCKKEYFFSSLSDAADMLIKELDEEIQKLIEKRILIIRNYKS